MTQTASSRPVVGAFAALTLLSITIAAAAEQQLVLDPGAARITFSLGATMHSVEGTAEIGEWKVAVEPDSGAANGRIVVATASLDTGHEGRDRKMHSQVLESETFAEIVFEPHAVRGEFPPEGESRLTVDGRLTIHGDTHPLSIEVVVQREGEQLTLISEFPVPYVAWGMTDPSRFVMRVAKEVRVRIEATGRLEPLLRKADE